MQLTGTRSRTGSGQPSSAASRAAASHGRASTSSYSVNGQNSPQPAGPSQQHALAHGDPAEPGGQRDRVDGGRRHPVQPTRGRIVGDEYDGTPAAAGPAQRADHPADGAGHAVRRRARRVRRRRSGPADQDVLPRPRPGTARRSRARRRAGRSGRPARCGRRCAPTPCAASTRSPASWTWTSCCTTGTARPRRGPGTREPGCWVGVSEPGGRYVPDPGADFHVVIGDESALPAVATVLAALPPGSRPWRSSRSPTPTRSSRCRAHATVQWVHRGDAGRRGAAGGGGAGRGVPARPRAGLAGRGVGRGQASCADTCSPSAGWTGGWSTPPATGGPADPEP